MKIERINKVFNKTINKPIRFIIDKYKSIQVDYYVKEENDKAGEERLKHPTKGNNFDIYA